jgi:hypothetical protein
MVLSFRRQVNVGHLLAASDDRLPQPLAVSAHEPLAQHIPNRHNAPSG